MCPAGLKWFMMEDERWGDLTDTDFLMFNPEPPWDFLGCGFGALDLKTTGDGTDCFGLTVLTELTAGFEAWTRTPDCDCLLMTTFPVASYLWSAGVKWLITPDFLSGDLTDTDFWRDNPEATLLADGKDDCLSPEFEEGALYVTFGFEGFGLGAGAGAT